MKLKKPYRHYLPRKEIGTVASSIGLFGYGADAVASQNSTSIANDSQTNITGHLIYEAQGKIVVKR